MYNSCDLEELLAPVDRVLYGDLQELARGFTFDERIEMWNDLRASYNYFHRNCFRRFDREVSRKITGKYRLAQLMLAASFKLNGEEVPEITRMFNEQEYQVLYDLEELKEIDFLSVEDLVEFIERREGKVYEMIKKYYERGYHMLDTKWVRMMGTLALALADKYKERRRKIEEAVIEYIKRRPLTVFVSEIEEAVKKALQAAFERKRAEAAIVKAERTINSLEPELSMASTPEEAVEKREKAYSIVEKLMRDLMEARDKLREKEEELRRVREKYSEESSAREVLEAELEALRSRVRELESLLEEYRRTAAILAAEKEAFSEEIARIRERIEGKGEGNVVTAEEAWALENSLVERIIRRIGDEAVIYDPIRGESRTIKWSRKIYYSLYDEGRPRGKGVQLVLMKGLIRRRKDVVVDVVSLVHKKAYEEKGLDSEPVTLGELMDIIESRLEEAGKGEYYTILIVGSPTGFSRKAREFIESSDYLVNFASKYVTVYLVDPVRGEVYYNRRDPAADTNKAIAEPRLSEERIRRVLDYLRSDEAAKRALVNNAARPFLFIDEIAKATGETPDIVAAALRRAEEKGYGRIRVKDEKIKVFYYNIDSIKG